MQQIIIFILILISHAAWAESQNPYQIQILTGWEKASPARLIKAEAVYGQDPNLVFESLKKYRAFPTYMPTVKRSQILKEEGNRAEVEVFSQMPWVLPNFTIRLEILSDPEKKEFVWKMISGNVRLIKGSARLERVGEGTRLNVEAQLDPGHFIPQFLVVREGKSFFQKTLTNLGKKLAREEKRRSRRKEFQKRFPSKTIDSRTTPYRGANRP